MSEVEWIILSATTATIIAVISGIMFQRRIKGSRHLLSEKKTSHKEFMTLGSSLVVLGIVFGTDRLIAYSFMGTGVLLIIISAIRSQRKARRSSEEMQ